MANQPNPDEIVKAIKEDEYKEARALGRLVESFGNRQQGESVLRGLKDDASLEQSFFEGAEEVQIIKSLRGERES